MGKAGQKESREMEIEMSVGEKIVRQRVGVAERPLCKSYMEQVREIDSACVEAEERGYQRGKAEDHFTIGLVMECRQEALDENKRLRGLLNMPLSAEQRTCMEREGLTVEEITSDWADLKMEGEALRKRLRSRAFAWKHAARYLQTMQLQQEYLKDRADLQMLIDMIYNMDRNCTMEADRLYDEHLRSLEPLCDTPEGTARLYVEHGHITAQTVIHRASLRKMAQYSEEPDPEDEGK